MREKSGGLEGYADPESVQFLSWARRWAALNRALLRHAEGHPMEPWADGIAALDRARAAGQGQERILEGVLGIVRLAEDGTANREDHRTVTLDQDPERVGVIRGDETIQKSVSPSWHHAPRTIPTEARDPVGPAGISDRPAVLLAGVIPTPASSREDCHRSFLSTASGRSDRTCRPGPPADSLIKDANVRRSRHQIPGCLVAAGDDPGSRRHPGHWGIGSNRTASMRTSRDCHRQPAISRQRCRASKRRRRPIASRGMRVGRRGPQGPGWRDRSSSRSARPSPGRQILHRP